MIMGDKSETFQGGRHFDRRSYLKIPVSVAAEGLFARSLGGTVAPLEATIDAAPI
jgi:hypothetical protein